MKEAELKEQVYSILRNRIRRRMELSVLAKDPDTLQHAVNITVLNIAVLATNRSLEVAIDYLYETQRKLLNGVTRDNITANAMDCREHFAPEMRVFREMHRMLDEGIECAHILARVRHLFDTDAKEIEPDIANQPDPFPGEWPFVDGPDDEDEEAFIRRVTSADEPNRKEDIVWNTITDSAKKRFDYENFGQVFAVTHNTTIPENVLFMTITGHAAGHSTDEIAAEINQQFLLIAYSLDEDYLKKFIEDRRSDLFREIKAAEQALAFYKMGLQTPGILVQIRSILSKP